MLFFITYDVCFKNPNLNPEKFVVLIEINVLNQTSLMFQLFFQILVLKYVSNKDVFMRYHKSHLIRRLILETSADNEKEENMVELLRVRSVFEKNNYFA